VTIGTSGNNLNILTALLNAKQATAGVAGSWTVTLTGVWGTATQGVAAVDTGVFPAGSVLTVINSGTINGNFTAASFPVNGVFQFSNKGTVTGTVTQ